MKKLKKIGFIGAGNMGGAIISGMIKSGNYNLESIYVYDKKPNDSILSLGVHNITLKEIVELCDIIILAVKPNTIPEVTKEIIETNVNISQKVFVSIAAGVRIETLSSMLKTHKIVRVMPNLCLTAGEGMCVLCNDTDITEDELSEAEKIFACSGKTLIIKEELINACTAINGSGPAYVFMFMEAMADAAVKYGIDRKSAYLLSAQTVLGSAAMMMESGLHPGVLKDMVCSPGGTTIEAVQALEDSGLRSSVFAAVDSCLDKANKMS